MIPESSIITQNRENKASQEFNITGICDPAHHYMVNLKQRLSKVRKPVDEGKYFIVNRARQYGKTSTLHALTEFLNDDYVVINMDFQMQMSDAKFKNENSFSLAFARAFENTFNITEYGSIEKYRSALNINILAEHTERVFSAISRH